MFGGTHAWASARAHDLMVREATAMSELPAVVPAPRSNVSGALQRPSDRLSPSSNARAVRGAPR